VGKPTACKKHQNGVIRAKLGRGNLKITICIDKIRNLQSILTKTMQSGNSTSSNTNLRVVLRLVERDRERERERGDVGDSDMAAVMRSGASGYKKLKWAFKIFNIIIIIF
jgi:hypothetical protein